MRRRRAAQNSGAPPSPRPTQAVAAPPTRGGLWSAFTQAVERWRAPRRLAQDGNLFMPSRSLHPPGVAGPKMAMDWGEDTLSAQSWAQSWPGVGCMAEGFLGYPILAELALRVEFRRIVETVASEMTREWIKLKSTGDEDKSDKITQINDAMQRYKLKECFRKVVEHDGFFGRGHLFIDLGKSDDRDEMLSPIGNGRDDASKGKVKKGSLKRFAPVEPVWTYPLQYNSIDPISPDWYVPTTWSVMSRSAHSSRLLTLIARQVPDLFKPSFSFGGLSLTQMVKPYVDKFVKDAMNISELVAAFSIMVLKTELGTQNQIGSDELTRRLDLFVKTRNNLGLMVLDKSIDETLENISAPLGGLEGLQAQSQEHIMAASGLPAIKYTGLTPTGLNASSEFEIRSFYDSVRASQEFLLREPITTALGFIQLSEFGEVDPEITFDFVSLWQLDDERKIAIERSKADIHDVYLTAGVVSPDTVRQAVAADPDSPYHGIDLSQDDDLEAPPAPPGSGNSPADPLTNRIEREATREAA